VRIFFSFLIIALLTVPVVSQASSGKQGRDEKFKSRHEINKSETTIEAGLKLPEWGIAIDASHDARLDDLIPGYRIVHVVLSNSRGDPILLDPSKDKWVVTDSTGRRHTAINHVQKIDRKLWEEMKPELKKKLDYPTVVKPNHLTTIDLFFSDSVDLFRFREISWNSSHFNKTFDIYTAYEKELSVEPDDKQQPLSQPSHFERYNPQDYNKTRQEILKPNPGQDSGQTDPEQETEIEIKTENQDPRFDPSFDDAIIIR